MPLKWKIFRIVDYLHITCITALAIYMLSQLQGTEIRSNNIGPISLFFLICAVLLTNAILNACLFEKWYPQKYPGRKMYNFSFAVYILSVLIILGLSILVIVIIQDEFFNVKYEESPPRLNAEDLMLMSAIFTVWATGIVIMILQQGLWKKVRRNYQITLDQFLEPE